MYQIEEEKLEYTTGQFVLFEIACLIPGLGLILSIIASKVSKNQSFENYAKTNKKKLGAVLSIVSVIVIVLTALFIPTLVNILW